MNMGSIEGLTIEMTLTFPLCIAIHCWLASNNQSAGPVDVDITMSLTTQGCGMADQMAQDIKQKVETLDGVNQTTVNVTFDPAWKPEMMTDEAKEKLGFYPTPAPSEKTESNEWE